VAVETKERKGEMMKTMKLANVTLKISDKEMSYDEAVKATPKGYEMINLTTFARVHEEVESSKLPFWFWIENYKWNKKDWQPVARGVSDFILGANYDRGASRGVYIKKEVQK
jgi:hypothetical protein